MCVINILLCRSLRRARDVREQLVGLMQRVEIEMVSNPTEIENIKKAITAGYFYHIARLSKGGNYKTVKHNQVHFHKYIYNSFVGYCIIFFRLSRFTQTVHCLKTSQDGSYTTNLFSQVKNLWGRWLILRVSGCWRWLPIIINRGNWKIPLIRKCLKQLEGVQELSSLCIYEV